MCECKFQVEKRHVQHYSLTWIIWHLSIFRSLLLLAWNSYFSITVHLTHLHTSAHTKSKREIINNDFMNLSFRFCIKFQYALELICDWAWRLNRWVQKTLLIIFRWHWFFFQFPELYKSTETKQKCIFETGLTNNETAKRNLILDWIIQ